MPGFFDELSTFFERKLRDGNFDRKTFAQATNIPKSILDKVLNKRPYSVNKVIESRPPQITIKSLLLIANHLNCSIDEMLGRNSFIPQVKGDFKQISSEGAMSSVREFISERLQESGLTIFELSKNCGFGKDTFSKFMKGGDSQAAMSTSAVIAIADYFNVPIDGLLGRKHVVAKELAAEIAPIIPKFLQGIDKKDLEAIEVIKRAGVSAPDTRAKSASPNPQVTKPPRVR